jgi:mRNA-degrading endonuclease RelE of RelBE toxin-antitoxin system
MTPYTVDAAPFEKFYADNSESLPLWAKLRLRQKVKAICALPDPLADGGRNPSTRKWHYNVGKFHIIAELDDATRTVRLLSYIRLP